MFSYFLEHSLDSVYLLRIFFAVFNFCLLINPQISNARMWPIEQAANIRNILNKHALVRTIVVII